MVPLSLDDPGRRANLGPALRFRPYHFAGRWGSTHANAAFLSPLRGCVSQPPTPKIERSPQEDLPMADPNGGPKPDGPPRLNVLAQYIKDFSFENPNAPQSLSPGQQPSINIQINVNARPLAQTDVEVELKLDGKAEAGGSVMFAFELCFAGVFRIEHVAPDSVQPLIMIECPRLLFPFAREIVASAVRNGGFPPLLIDPVDFAGLYRQRVAEVQPQQPQTMVS